MNTSMHAHDKADLSDLKAFVAVVRLLCESFCKRATRRSYLWLAPTKGFARLSTMPRSTSVAKSWRPRCAFCDRPFDLYLGRCRYSTVLRFSERR